MITIIIDKGLDSEVSCVVDQLFDHPLTGNVSGTCRYESVEDLPDISEFKNPFFTTVEAVYNGEKMPLNQELNHIADVGIDYYSEDIMFSITLNKV